MQWIKTHSLGSAAGPVLGSPLGTDLEGMISSKPRDGCMQLLINKLIYPKVFWKLYEQDEKIITITKPQDPESVQI